MAYGQGTINFANKVSASAIDAPVTDFAGTRLAGADFLAQLYAGTGGTFKAYGAPVPFRTGAAAGYISANVVTLDGVAAGSAVDVQMRAWRAAAGASYEAALGSGLASAGGNYGFSATLAGVVTGNAGTPPSLPTDLRGLTGFAFVPEPSTIALGLLGAAVLFLRRRK